MSSLRQRVFQLLEEGCGDIEEVLAVLPSSVNENTVYHYVWEYKSQKTPYPQKGFLNEELKEVAYILNFDVRRGGEVMRSRCPKHGKEYLVYYYTQGSGVEVHCCRCDWHTLFPEERWDH